MSALLVLHHRPFRHAAQARAREKTAQGDIGKGACPALDARRNTAKRLKV